MIDASSSVNKVNAPAGVLAALQEAARATGADFSYLVQTAQRESNFNPTAKASTSTATGLFQFTNETWLRMVDRYGSQHGVPAGQAGSGTSGDGSTAASGLSRDQILNLRNDPVLAARMAGELAQENAKILEKKIGRPPTSAELYAAHFMGPSDAAHLIQSARRNDPAPASATFESAALANPTVFEGHDGRALNAAQLYVRLTGGGVGAADAGASPASVVNVAQSAPGPLTAPPSSEAVLAARIGVAQLTSGLLAALFDVQSTKG